MHHEVPVPVCIKLRHREQPEAAITITAKRGKIRDVDFYYSFGTNLPASVADYANLDWDVAAEREQTNTQQTFPKKPNRNNEDEVQTKATIFTFTKYCTVYG